MVLSKNNRNNSEMKYTPGPWRVENGVIQDHNALAVFGPREHTQPGYPDNCICLVSPGDQVTEIDKANAAVIAAAPQMLDALMSIRGLEPWISDDKMRQLFQKKVYGAINAALNEAHTSPVDSNSQQLSNGNNDGQ
jgi:hypothetical protein